MWQHRSMLRACSHLVLASDDVPRITRFFGEAFAIPPHFANELFAEFVLPSAFRIAFFKPVGPTAKTFTTSTDRRTASIGITVEDVDAVHTLVAALEHCTVSGLPKDHPWGERSFLLTDPDGNRWEVTQSPSANGMLTDR
jgi:Glyoxalase/Bleomycin resistance protein/Dioxygenase superfamily